MDSNFWSNENSKTRPSLHFNFGMGNKHSGSLINEKKTGLDGISRKSRNVWSVIQIESKLHEYIYSFHLEQFSILNVKSNKLFALVLLYYALWFISKTRATFSTNVKQNPSQSWLCSVIDPSANVSPPHNTYISSFSFAFAFEEVSCFAVFYVSAFSCVVVVVVFSLVFVSFFDAVSCVFSLKNKKESRYAQVV